VVASAMAGTQAMGAPVLPLTNTHTAALEASSVRAELLPAAGGGKRAVRKAGAGGAAKGRGAPMAVYTTLAGRRVVG
jgi:hypothetical protein